MKFLINTRQNRQGHHKQGKSKKVPEPRGAKETGRRTVMWDLDGVLGRMKKGKKQRNLNKRWMLVNNNILILNKCAMLI